VSHKPGKGDEAECNLWKGYLQYAMYNKRIREGKEEKCGYTYNNILSSDTSYIGNPGKSRLPRIAVCL
jgi:hypothetical protein